MDQRTTELGYRPLYRQVRDVLLRRIADGVWQAGQMLPSEPELAADLGVSPGTVRKALDEMTAENLLVRKQGRGTFLARHDDERMLFQFFKLVRDDGERRFPESRVVEVGPASADAATAKALAIRKGAAVLQIERVRSLAGTTCIFERIWLPRTLFPGLGKQELPNNLYNLYATEFGVTIARASERIKAVAARAVEAKHLDVDLGTPLLSIDRTAFAIDGTPAERRVSICRTDHFHYACDPR